MPQFQLAILLYDNLQYDRIKIATEQGSHYRVPLSYKLTTFQIPGQKLSKKFVGILVETMTPRGHFENN